MVQNADGGWGETCTSYDDPTLRGIGPSTPSQTAWAVLGLLAAGDFEFAFLDNTSAVASFERDPVEVNRALDDMEITAPPGWHRER